MQSKNKKMNADSLHFLILIFIGIALVYYVHCTYANKSLQLTRLAMASNNNNHKNLKTSNTLECDAVFNSPSFRPRVNKTVVDKSDIHTFITKTLLTIINLIFTTPDVKNATFQVKGDAKQSTLNEIHLNEKINLPLGFYVTLQKINGVNDSIVFSDLLQIQDHYSDASESIHVVTGILLVSLNFNLSADITGTIPAISAELFSANFNAVCTQCQLTLRYRCKEQGGTELIDLKLSNFQVLDLSYTLNSPLKILGVEAIANAFVNIKKSLQEKLNTVMNESPNVLEIVNKLINKQFPRDFPDFLGCLNLPQQILKTTNSSGTVTSFNGLLDWGNTRTLPPPDGTKLAQCALNCLQGMPKEIDWCQTTCARNVAATKNNISVDECASLCANDADCSQFDYIPALGSPLIPFNDYSHCFVYGSTLANALPQPTLDTINYRKMVSNVSKTFPNPFNPKENITVKTQKDTLHSNFSDATAKPATNVTFDCLQNPKCLGYDVKSQTLAAPYEVNSSTTYLPGAIIYTLTRTPI